MKTTVDVAREILREQGVLRACREYRAEATGATGLACWPHFNLNHEHGVVKFVEFQPAVEIPVERVIARHGEPEGVLSAYTDFPDGSIYTVLLLYYERIWTTMSLVEQVPRTYRVVPGTLVRRITYSEPHPAVVAASCRTAWRGYGEYPASDATAG